MMLRPVDNLMAAIRRRAHDQSGIGIMESLVAVLVLGTGLLGTIAAITSARSTTESARRADTAVHIAQQQLELMQATPYHNLKMNSLPTGALYPDAPASHPNSRVFNFGGFYIFNFHGSSWERLADAVNQAAVAPSDIGTAQITPTDTSATTGGMIPEGYTVYRYVTYRVENCGRPSCDGTKANSKRLIVAVTADPVGSGVGPGKPIMTSTIVLDPSDPS